MDLNKKIEQIIIDKGVSPSSFADAIDVPRSSISHILSGRNKPSLDMIQRILKTYPDIDRDWLLFDSDIPAQNTLQINRQQTVIQRVTPQINFEGTQRESNKNIQPEQNAVQTNVNPSPRRKIERPVVQTQPSPSGKQIERIVIFYTDGTFMESKPN
jgi:plasmid maintenance system antidote protein VapI